MAGQCCGGPVRQQLTHLWAEQAQPSEERQSDMGLSSLEMRRKVDSGGSHPCIQISEGKVQRG